MQWELGMLSTLQYKLKVLLRKMSPRNIAIIWVWRKISRICSPDGWKFKKNSNSLPQSYFIFCLRPRLHIMLNNVHHAFSPSKHFDHAPACLWLSTLFLILTSVKYCLSNTIIPLLIQLKVIPLSPPPFYVQTISLKAGGKGKTRWFKRQRWYFWYCQTNWSSRRVRIAV